jgi:putative aldouronate transport system substrate-binding protein
MKKGLLLLLMTLLALSLFANGGKESTAADSKDAGPYEFTVFAKWPPEATDVDKAFFKGMEEALNLKINLEIPPSANYNERQQIMMATGDFPELVLFNGTADKTYVDAVKNELVLPLNDYLDNAPNIMKYSYQVSFDSFKTMNDDRIFGIPRTSVARADGFSVRADWVKTLGIDFVKDGGTISLDEYTELMKAFTRDDPDGNGLDDTYGMLVSADAKGNMSIPGHVLWSYGVIGWQKYGNTFMDLKYSQDHDNYKKSLAYANMLWNEKVVDPDWPTLSYETAKERWDSGAFYGMKGEFAGWTVAQQLTMQGFVPEAELVYITGIENEGGVVKGGSFSTGTWGLWGVMAGTEQPEKVVGMLDYALSDNYWDAVAFGPEGLTWNETNGVKVPTDVYKDHKYGRQFVRRNDDPGFFISLDMSDANRSRLGKLIGICIEQAVFSKSEGFRPAAADSQSYLDAETKLNTMISKIIVGQEPVDAWDGALAEWYADGGAQYVKEMNDYIVSKN